MSEEKARRQAAVKTKKAYEPPTIKSQVVLERAALTCSGYFTNNQWDDKQNGSECGFNDS